MTPRIEIYFRIIGSFDPNNFTKKVGLKPTSTWKCGDIVGNTLITRKEDGWEFSTPETDSHDLDIEINKLISLLDPYRLQITNLCKENDLESEFACVVKTEGNEFPSIHLDKRLLDNIRVFNAGIDIDMY